MQLQPKSDGLQPSSDDPQPTRDGLQPKSWSKEMPHATSRLEAIYNKKLLGWRPSLLGWRPSLLGWNPQGPTGLPEIVLVVGSLT